MPALFDEIGKTYANSRRQDPRINESRVNK
jgi:hypothetical protein